MRGRIAALILAGAVPWLLPASDARSAHPPIAAPADDDDDEVEGASKGPRLAPGQGLGLILTLSRGATADARPARLVALAVPEGTPPSAFLAPGPFRATWEGNLASPFRSEYDFMAAGRGTIKVEVNGKVALEGSGDDLSKLKGKTAKLKKGANALVVTYDSPEKGDASIRLSWASEDEGFVREPIAPYVLSHDLATPRLVDGNRLREGRELLAELRCLRCHAAPASAPTPGGMPELAMDAPNLDDAGARLRAGWMARWIDDPRSLRPAATMPRVFHGKPAIAAGSDIAAAPAPSDAARDLAAFLASQGGAKGEAAPPAPDAEAVAAGGRLFAGLGCVGCHTRPDRDDWAADPARIPLRYVAAKWKPEALRSFLLQPDRHYAWIRMPNFHLSQDEAAKLAAFVASGPAADLDPGASAGDPARGQALFASAGCVNCHAAKPAPNPTAPALAAIPADGWSRGCLDPESKPDRKAPDFGLADGPRQAIRSFATAEAAPASLARDAAPEFAERQIKALRCASCHKRDGYEDAWSSLAPEVANLAADANAGAVEVDPDGHPYPALQSRPPLTWIGEKLKPEWSNTFIAGTLDYKPRPYLKARMPGFPARAEGLAVGLSLEHGYAAASPPDAAPDPAHLADAKALVRSTGLNCVSCHKVGNVAAVGVFEAPGINFMHVKERLRKDYYDRWVRAPLRVDPDTKMPSFFNGEASVLPTILDGRADRQAEALWNYLLQGRAIEAP
ncbi:hypothetical protein TA3x_001703 [Tundrisphaera sp. TA3]|uniref:hypothetical protein n=1 Tax=Tundrisphaera sp. TA3 TaxID=3435775 RepID=UPI003EBC42F5